MCVCVFVLLFVIVLIIAYVDFEDALAVRPSIRETGERQRHRERERERETWCSKKIHSVQHRASCHYSCRRRFLRRNEHPLFM